LKAKQRAPAYSQGTSVFIGHQPIQRAPAFSQGANQFMSTGTAGNLTTHKVMDVG